MTARYLLATVPAAVVQCDSFHRDLNAEKLKISAVPAVSSMLYTHSEAAGDITHTFTLMHKYIHTLENATKQTQPHKCTRAYINTNTRLHALFVASVSHSATFTSACNSETAAHLLCQ